MAYTDLLNGLYQQRPDLFSTEDVDSLQNLYNQAGQNFKPNQEAYDWNIGNTLNNVWTGFIEGFTTAPAGEWMGVKRNSTVDEIAHSIGSLMGFIGFIPGVGSAARIGLSSLVKAGSKTFLKSMVTRLPESIMIKSFPMIIADKSMQLLSKTGAGAMLDTVKFLKEGTVGRQMLKSGLHLGIASAAGSAPLWTTAVDERLEGFGWGAAFGVGNTFLGQLIGKGRPLDFSPSGKTREELLTLSKTDPELAGILKNKDNLVNNIARGISSGVMFGMPSTVLDKPLELQVYEYLLNGFFGFREMPMDQRIALNMMKPYKESAGGISRNMLINPKELWKDKWESLPKGVREELELQSEIEFGSPLGQYSNSEYAMLGSIKDAKAKLDQDFKDGKVSPDQYSDYTKSMIVEDELFKAAKEGKSEEVAVENAKDRIYKEANELFQAYRLSAALGTKTDPNTILKNQEFLQKRLDYENFIRDNDLGIYRGTISDIAGKLAKEMGVEDGKLRLHFEKVLAEKGAEYLGKLDGDPDKFIADTEKLFGIEVPADGKLDIRRYFRKVSQSVPRKEIMLDGDIEKGKNPEFMEPSPIDMNGNVRRTIFMPESEGSRLIPNMEVLKKVRTSDGEIDIHKYTEMTPEHGLTIENILESAAKRGKAFYFGKKQDSALIFGDFLITDADLPEYLDLATKYYGDKFTESRNLWNGDKAIHDKIYANEIKFLKEFNFPGDKFTAEYAVQEFKKNPKNFIISPKDLNKRGQLFDTWSQRLDAKEMTKIMGKDMATVAILKAVNSDDTNHDGTGKAEFYHVMDDKGNIIAKIHDAHYDGGVIFRQKLYDTALESSGFTKESSAFKGIAIERGDDRGLGGFMSKRAVFPPDAKLNKIMEDNGIDIIEMDTSAKQVGLRPVNDNWKLVVEGGKPDIKPTDTLQDTPGAEPIQDVRVATKGGFENIGKGTPMGDGKDKAMRQVADDFIGEIFKEDSSTGTSKRTIEINRATKLANILVEKFAKGKHHEVELSIRSAIEFLYRGELKAFENGIKDIFLNIGGEKKLADDFLDGIIAEYHKFEQNNPAKVTMLARNKEFANKPLKPETEQQILDFHNEGKEFVVGDMPGVDSQFIDYLNKIGAKYTIYHTGKTSRIKPIQSITQQEKVSPARSNEVIEQSEITRQDLRSNPDKVYLFGDNLERKGLGGQAKSMRGEPNAIGIPTKKKPSMTGDSFMSDADYDSNIKAIDEAFARIPQGKTIVIPKAGIGTGLAKLQEKAPKTFEYLQNKLNSLKGETIAQEPIPEVIPEPITELSELTNALGWKTFELKWDSITIDNADVIDLKKSVRVVKQLLSNIHDPKVQDIAKEFFIDSSLKGVDEANKKFESGDETVEIDDLSFQNKLKILSSNTATKLWKKLHNEIFNLDDADLIEDGISSPESVAEAENFLRLKGNARRIIESVELSPAILRWPTVSDYYQAALNRYLFKSVVTPKTKNGMTSVFKMHLPTDFSVDGTKIDIKPGEIWYGRDAMDKVVTIQVGKDTHTGKLGDLWKKYRDNDDAMTFLVMRTPADSPSGIRVLRFKGFGDWKGTSAKVHAEEYMALGGADNDIDKMNTYFSAPKEVKDYYNKYRDQWWTVKDGKKVFKPVANSMTYPDSKISDMTFSPISLYRANAVAAQGNNKLGFGLSMGNRLITLVNTLKYKGLTEDARGNRYSHDIDELMEANREVVNNAADSANGIQMYGMNKIRDTLLDRILTRKRLDKNDNWVGSEELGVMAAYDRLLKGEIRDGKTWRKASPEELFKTLNALSASNNFQNIHYKAMNEMGKYSFEIPDWKGTNYENMFEVVQTAFNPKNTEGFAKELRSALGRDLSINDKQRKKMMDTWEKKNQSKYIGDAEGYEKAKNEFKSAMYVQDFMDVASAALVMDKAKGIDPQTRKGILSAVKKFKEELMWISKGKRGNDTTLAKTKLIEQMSEYAKELTDVKQKAYYEALIVSSLKPQDTYMSREALENGPIQDILNGIDKIAKKHEIQYNSFRDLVSKLESKLGEEHEDITKAFVKMEEIKNTRKGWYESNIDSFFLNNDNVSPTTLGELAKYYNKFTEATFKQKEQPLPEPEQTVIDKFTEVKEEIVNLNQMITKKIAGLKEGEVLPKDLVDLQARLTDILGKRPYLLANIADRYAMFMEHTTGISKTIDQMTKGEFRSFVEYLEGIENNKGLKLGKLDYFRLPDWLSTKHEPFDDKNTVEVDRYVYDRDTGKFLKARLQAPMSRMKQNNEAALMLGKRKGQAEKFIENMIANHPITRMLDKLGDDGKRLFDYMLAVRQLPRDRDVTKNRFYHDEFDAVNKSVKDLKDKKFPVVDDKGKQVSYTFDQIVERMQKELTNLSEEAWTKDILGGFKSFEEAKKHHLEPYLIDGWLDYEKFTGDMVKKLFNKNVVEEYGIAIKDYIANTHLAMIYEFPVDTPEGTRTKRAIDLPTAKERAEFLNERMRETRPVQDEKGIVIQIPRYQWMDFGKKYKEMDPFWYESYWPHMDMPAKAKERKRAEIQAIKDEAKKKREEAALDELEQTEHLADGGANQDVIAGLEGSLNPADIEVVLTRRSGNLMKRDDMSPIPGYSRDFTAFAKYKKGLAADYWNGITAIVLHSNVDQFVKDTMTGKNNIGKENAKPWAAFMRQGIREIVGYPSTLPTEWVLDPQYKIKGNPYWFVTEDYWARKATILDKFFGIKGETNYKIRAAGVSRKIASLSNAEGKWSMMSLLFSPKTYLVNLGTANMNTIVSTGWRHWRNTANLPKLKTINPEWKSWSDVEKDVYELGGIESFIKSIAPLSQQFTAGNAKRFFTKAIDLLKRDRNSSDASLYELAKQEGLTQEFVDKSAYFMRKSERQGRVRAWLAHYLKAREVFDATSLTFEWNDPWLIEMANKGVKATQFLYDDAARPQFARTNLGKIFTRFQLFALNSVAWRGDILKSAAASGWNKDTEEYKRFQRLATADLFVMSLASLLPYSIFNSAIPPPFNYLEGSMQFLFGKDEEKEKAFYGILPYPANIIQPVLPPSSRVFTSTFSMLLTGDWERYVDYHMWTFFPFGRFANDTKRSLQNPYLFFERSLGIPWNTLHEKMRKENK